MPSSPLPTASSAGSFIKQNWGLAKGNSRYLSFVEDPIDKGNKEEVLRVEYPKGSYSGNHGGGVGNMHMAVFGEEKNRAMVTYQVRRPLFQTSYLSR
jgi:hypothetical protein